MLFAAMLLHQDSNSETQACSLRNPIHKTCNHSPSVPTDFLCISLSLNARSSHGDLLELIRGIIRVQLFTILPVMMLGLEQYLQHRSDQFAPGNEHGDPESGLSFSSGAISEEITDIDEKEDPVEYQSSEQARLKESLNLLKILSGKQSAFKAAQTKKKVRNLGLEEKKYLESELTDSSLDAPMYEPLSEKADLLKELEQRMYSSRKSASAMDLLNIRRAEKHEENLPSEEHVEVIPDHESSDCEPEVIEEIQTNKVAVRDIFSSFGHRRKMNKDGEWKLEVKLRISPNKLGEIKKYDDPFRTRGINPGGSSMINTLMRKRHTKIVTLRLPSNFLQEIQKTLNPLYTKSSGIPNGKSARCVFDEMMQSASVTAYPKLTPLQKAKELYPPPIRRQEMHVIDRDQLLHISTSSNLKPREKRTSIHENLGSLSSLCIHKYPPQNGHESISSILNTIDDIDDFIADKAPLAFESQPHTRIYKQFIQHHALDNNQLWTDKFSPPSADDLLLDPQTRYTLGRWINNAFSILKSQSTKTPRNVKIREQQMRQRKKQSQSMQGFIVNDIEDDSEETEEDVFVPVLILQGPLGCGKSAAVYAAMKALDGYVYEINAGQNRSRRDLYGPLKEFCTTNIISQRGQEKSFQEGLVFFEDCDVLFEQDKTFWTAVQDVINFSKRPIVISAQDTPSIPRSIWEQAEEQNSVIYIESQDTEAFKQYIWLCCFSEGYDLSDNILDWVSKQSNRGSYDVRKALMISQWLCKEDVDLNSDETLLIDMRRDQTNDSNYDSSLEAFARERDILSSSDVIVANMRSVKLQEQSPNELLDSYIVDDGQSLHPSPEPDECNVGKYIHNRLNVKNDKELSLLLFNKIRSVVLEFVASRTKKRPKFLQDYYGVRTSTRSRSSESSFDLPMLDAQDLPETSVCYSMSKTSFILELAAYCRDWARFQKALYDVERERRQKGEDISIEAMGWRHFQKGTAEILSVFPNVKASPKSISS